MYIYVYIFIHSYFFFYTVKSLFSSLPHQPAVSPRLALPRPTTSALRLPPYNSTMPTSSLSMTGQAQL